MKNDFQDLTNISMDEIRSAIYLTPSEAQLAEARHFVSCVMVTAIKHLLAHDKPIQVQDFADMVLDDHPDLKEDYTHPGIESACVDAMRLIYTDHEIVETTTDQGPAFIVKQDHKSIKTS